MTTKLKEITEPCLDVAKTVDWFVFNCCGFALVLRLFVKKKKAGHRKNVSLDKQPGDDRKG